MNKEEINLARANVYNPEQVKKAKRNRILAIAITVGTILVAGIVCLILWLTGVFTKDDEKYNAFGFDTFVSHVINYGELAPILENNELSVMVFIYDSTTFDPQERIEKDGTLVLNEEDTDYNKDDEEIYKQVVSLISTIDESEHKDAFTFYIMNTSVSGNEEILENETYGSITVSPNLIYCYQGAYVTNVPDHLAERVDEKYKDITLSNASSKKVLINMFKNIKPMISNYS